MKTVNITKLAIPALLLISGTALAQLDGSSHDLSGGTFGNANDNGEICVYCHAPHNAVDNIAAPLWNKNSTTATYTPYSSTTLVAAAVGSPGTVSLACLSCHDGTVAADQMVNAPGLNNTEPGTDFMTDASAAFVGTDLRDDHPVGTNYATAQGSDTGLQPSPLNGLTLYGGNVECASCHDVHDTALADGSFLALDNANSAICTSCHIK